MVTGIVGTDDVDVVDLDRASALLRSRAVFSSLYGSQATGTARPDSDVDVDVAVLVDGSEPGRLLLASDVADRLGAAAELGGIEVTVLDDAPLRFQGRVLRDRIVLFSRDEPRRVCQPDGSDRSRNGCPARHGRAWRTTVARWIVRKI